VVKPAGRRRLVGYLRQHYVVSERRACRLIRISRKAIRYEPQRPHRDVELVSRLKTLGEQYPRYGYLMLHGMLRTEGVVENPKRTYRLYSELGMQVRTKRRRKLIRPRVPMALPSRPNERWSADFVHDQLADGRRIRILNIVDDFSRVCVGQLVDLSISGARMVRLLDELSDTRGLPNTLVLDNGPEMTSKAMFFWSRKHGVKLHFIQHTHSHGEQRFLTLGASRNGRLVVVSHVDRAGTLRIVSARRVTSRERRNYEQYR
jgi:putative transposase